MKIVMLVLSWLMVTHVLYPAVPNITFPSWKGFIALALVLGTLAGFLFKLFSPSEFFFPALMAYVLWGLLKTVFVGLMDRVPTGDPLFEEGDDDDADHLMRPVIVGESPGRRKRRRRGRGDRQTPPINRSITESE